MNQTFQLSGPRGEVRNRPPAARGNEAARCGRCHETLPVGTRVEIAERSLGTERADAATGAAYPTLAAFVRWHMGSVSGVEDGGETEQEPLSP